MSTSAAPEQRPPPSFLAQRNQRYPQLNGNTTTSPPPTPASKMYAGEPPTPFSKRALTCDDSLPSKRAKITPTRSPSTRPSTSNSHPKTDPTFSNKLTTIISITTRGNPTADAKTTQLHVDVLSAKSPVLRHLALTSPTPDIKLLELNSEAFAVFTHWAYRDNITFATEGDEGDVMAQVLECYCLAQTLRCPGFSNAILARACGISSEHGLVFRNEVIDAIYTRTARGSTIQR